MCKTEWCRIIPGGGAYDFFILRDTDLLGVSFSDGLTCLTTWESLGITLSPVEGVYLGDGTFLLLLRDGETWDRSVTQITLPGTF